MRTLVLISLLATLMLAPAAAENDVPYAEPPVARPGQPNDLLLPALGDIMLTTQMRHIKLWYAGKTASWRLAAYELQQMQDNLAKAAVLYSAIPIEEIQKVDGPVGRMRQAIGKRDAGRFAEGFTELTAACNSCHQAGGVEFIRIQTPTSPAFSDQSYPDRP